MPVTKPLTHLAIEFRGTEVGEKHDTLLGDFFAKLWPTGFASIAGIATGPRSRSNSSGSDSSKSSSSSYKYKPSSKHSEKTWGTNLPVQTEEALRKIREYGENGFPETLTLGGHSRGGAALLLSLKSIFNAYEQAGHQPPIITILLEDIVEGPLDGHPLPEDLGLTDIQKGCIKQIAYIPSSTSKQAIHNTFGTGRGGVIDFQYLSKVFTQTNGTCPAIFACALPLEHNHLADTFYDRYDNSEIQDREIEDSAKIAKQAEITLNSMPAGKIPEELIKLAEKVLAGKSGENIKDEIEKEKLKAIGSKDKDGLQDKKVILGLCMAIVDPDMKRYHNIMMRLFQVFTDPQNAHGEIAKLGEELTKIKHVEELHNIRSVFRENRSLFGFSLPPKGDQENDKSTLGLLRKLVEQVFYSQQHKTAAVQRVTLFLESYKAKATDINGTSKGILGFLKHTKVNNNYLSQMQRKIQSDYNPQKEQKHSKNLVLPSATHSRWWGKYVLGESKAVAGMLFALEKISATDIKFEELNNRAQGLVSNTGAIAKFLGQYKESVHDSHKYIAAKMLRIINSEKYPNAISKYFALQQAARELKAKGTLNSNDDLYKALQKIENHDITATSDLKFETEIITSVQLCILSRLKASYEKAMAPYENNDELRNILPEKAVDAKIASQQWAAKELNAFRIKPLPAHEKEILKSIRDGHSITPTESTSLDLTPKESTTPIPSM